jgi:hypothetical protein
MVTNVSEEPAASIFMIVSLKLEEKYSSETSITSFKAIQCRDLMDAI